jgi:hypothetical protein
MILVPKSRASKQADHGYLMKNTSKKQKIPYPNPISLISLLG